MFKTLEKINLLTRCIEKINKKKHYALSYVLFNYNIILNKKNIY